MDASSPLRLLRVSAEKGTSSEQLVRTSLAKIRESPSAFVQVFEESALECARSVDKAEIHGPLAGIPIAVKDLLDVARTSKASGSPTVLGERVATEDAVVVRRLREAGAVIIGKTHLSELAFTGLGYNPHYDTPLSPFGRLPGGSSSGSGVAVSLGLVPAAVGTDTGGSVRIPAAWCGVTGFKPTVGRVPTEGCQTLSDTLDSIGPLANSVEDCALLFRVMAGLPEAQFPLEPSDTSQLRFLVPNLSFVDVDGPVLAAFETALTALEAAGTSLVRAEVPELALTLSPTINLMVAEFAATHRDITDCADMDKIVSGRLRLGSQMKAVDYLHATSTLRSLRTAVDRATKGFDGMLMPTVAVVPPTLEHVLSSEAAMAEAAGKTSHFTRIGNGLRRCAVSLPCHLHEGEGSSPVGLMVVGETDGDEACLAVSAAVEAVLRKAGLGVRKP